MRKNKFYFGILFSCLFSLIVQAEWGDSVKSDVRAQATRDIESYFQAFKLADLVALKKSVTDRYIKDFGPDQKLKKVLSTSQKELGKFKYEVLDVTQGDSDDQVIVTCVRSRVDEKLDRTSSASKKSEPGSKSASKKNRDAASIAGTKKRMIQMVRVDGRYKVDRILGSGDPE